MTWILDPLDFFLCLLVETSIQVLDRTGLRSRHCRDLRACYVQYLDVSIFPPFKQFRGILVARWWRDSHSSGCKSVFLGEKFKACWASKLDSCWLTSHFISIPINRTILPWDKILININFYKIVQIIKYLNSVICAPIVMLTHDLLGIYPYIENIRNIETQSKYSIEITTNSNSLSISYRNLSDVLYRIILILWTIPSIIYTTFFQLIAFEIDHGIDLNFIWYGWVTAFTDPDMSQVSRCIHPQILYDNCLSRKRYNDWSTVCLWW